MGAKFSKSGKAGEKPIDGVVDESSDTFNKTSTLPATFRKKDEEANKAGTLPRGGLDRSTSFSKRFRKSMTKLVRHKKTDSDAHAVTETDDPIVNVESVKEEEENTVTGKDVVQEDIKIAEEPEDDLKTAQMKARAQFFEDMYNSDEPVSIPKPPRTYAEKVNEDDEIETVSVSVIGTPVVKLIDKHEEGNEAQQETKELNAETDQAGVEVVDPIVNNKQETVASTESKQAKVHEDTNDCTANDNSAETVKATQVEKKIDETITEKLDISKEVNVTCTVDDPVIEQDVTELPDSEQKAKLPEKVECEDSRDENQAATIEGGDTKNELEKDEQAASIESSQTTSQEETNETEGTSKLDSDTDLITKNNSTEEISSHEENTDVAENDHACEQSNQHQEHETESDPNEKQEVTLAESTANVVETLEILESDIIDDTEGSGALSLESKTDSQIDDLSSEGGSEGGITTDEGIVASDDEEKVSEKNLKQKLNIPDESKGLVDSTNNELCLVTAHE